jgi:ubiquinone/menaquinone biosynthesis C-methylase UbiE
VIHEIYRVLKPDGSLYFWDIAVEKTVGLDQQDFAIYMDAQLPDRCPKPVMEATGCLKHKPVDITFNCWIERALHRLKKPSGFNFCHSSEEIRMDTSIGQLIDLIKLLFIMRNNPNREKK